MALTPDQLAQCLGDARASLAQAQRLLESREEDKEPLKEPPSAASDWSTPPPVTKIVFDGQMREPTKEDIAAYYAEHPEHKPPAAVEKALNRFRKNQTKSSPSYHMIISELTKSVESLADAVDVLSERDKGIRSQLRFLEAQDQTSDSSGGSRGCKKELEEDVGP